MFHVIQQATDWLLSGFSSIVYIHMLYSPKTKKWRYRLYLPLFVITSLTLLFHSMHYDIKTLVTPKNVQFQVHVFFSYSAPTCFSTVTIFREHTQKISLKCTAINTLQYIFVVMSIVQIVVKIIMYIKYKILL